MTAGVMFVCVLGVVTLLQSSSAQFSSSAGTTSHHHVHHSRHQYTGPTTTKEPNEHENFLFHYVPNTHHMILATGHTCYVFNLTDDERVAVHTDTGITQIELKLLTMLRTATLTLVDQDMVGKSDAHACGRHMTSYYTVSQ